MSWTTRDELAFLDGIGTYREGAPGLPDLVSPDARRDALKGYLVSLSRRHDWGLVDANEVRRHVIGMIARLELLVKQKQVDLK
jgi:hypothetical protein